MAEYYRFGSQLREFLRGLSRIDEGRMQVGEPLGDLTGNFASAAEVEAYRARALRRDPLRVPGSRHIATVLAYGRFVFDDGTNVVCEAIPGLSGVTTSADVRARDDGRPEVELTRFLTHFHFDDPQVLIEQHPLKPSTGLLTGADRGDASSLFPGRATFSQYIFLTVNGVTLTNRNPLVMTADRVDEWPPIGADFVSLEPTEFFELDDIDNPQARARAVLSKCDAIPTSEVSMPLI